MTATTYKLFTLWRDGLTQCQCILLQYAGRQKGWVPQKETAWHSAFWAAQREAESWGEKWKSEEHGAKGRKADHTLQSLIEAEGDRLIEGDGFIPIEGKRLCDLASERADILDCQAVIDSEGWVLVGYRRKDGSQWVQPIVRVLQAEVA